MKNPLTMKFMETAENTTVEHVHDAIRASLEDPVFGEDVQDKRILFTIDGTQLRTYFRVNG